jgi:aarF domain-containing kinase
LKEGKAVPSTRIGRAMGFASLGVGLAAGTAFEVASRVVSRVTEGDNNSQGSVITNDANSDRLAKTLCRMRGAALKLGQMLSIQDETLLPQPLAKALEQVRQGADAMPLYQLQAKLKEEFGEDWKDKFVSFSEMPFAAASIGQVHLATITSEDDQDQQQLRKVVVKCQYPGVADSIDSDLNNLSMIVKMTGMTPPGLFIDEVIRVGREELIVECNYLLEAENQNRFRKLVEEDDELSKAKFKVPTVVHELTTANVITTEYCPGGTIDKVAFLDQEERNRIGRNIMRLTMKELFTWRFMQTDPNWGNFLYDVGTGTTFLIDFGSAR